MFRLGRHPVTTRLGLPGGGDVELQVRRSKRARRILLQVETTNGAVELVLPPRVPVDEALSFARSKAGWLEQRLDGIPRRIPFAGGVEIPVLGAPVTVRFFDQPLKAVERDGDALLVAGRGEDVPDLVRGWLRLEAGREIRHRVEEGTGALGRRFNRVTIRDPHTLWGSCSQKGNLSFSWRLVMAPERVLDYVVAHEVAHLAEMNHGPRFWTIVDGLCEDAKASRSWLRRNGRELHRYG